MSRTAKADRCLTSEEQRLVRHYIREGGTEDKLARAARKTKITLEKAQTLLKRIHVAEELARRRHLLEYEQAKLDAADLNRRESEEDKRIDLTEKLIFEEMRDLIRTPAKKLGDGHKAKSELLRLAAVFTGTIRDGRLERLLPPDQGPGSGGGGPVIYQDVFTRMALQAQGGVADLYSPAEDVPAQAAANSPVAAPATNPVAAITPDDMRAAAHRAKRVLEVPVPAAAAAGRK
jgi:hypothetical protein